MKAINRGSSGVLAIMVAFGLIVLLLLLSGCSSDSSTNPPAKNKSYLAGGGRNTGTDEFRGGPGDSGPNDSIPNVPPDSIPVTQYLPVFFGELSCQVIADNLVITNKADWKQFWDSAMSCSFWWKPRGGSPQGDSVVSDSGWFPPDSIRPDPPEVDFTRDVVVAITVEPDSIWGRSIALTNVVSSGGSTTINYLVCYPDSDCYFLIDPIPRDTFVYGGTTYLLAAFAVPRFSTDNLIWERKDTTYSCGWHPDPKEPLTLYYTDALCELGNGEQLFTNKTDFEDWVEKALECDRQRWEAYDTAGNGSDSVIYFPGDWYDRPTERFDFNVDFTKCAVIILRAGEQTRWGGGIWLNAFTSADGGTEIEYSVMEPGPDCPEIGSVPWYSDGAISPTVAIQIPLPINSPVKWIRQIERIDCNWQDTTWVDSGPRKQSRQ
jgi:hypothetical protein